MADSTPEAFHPVSLRDVARSIGASHTAVSLALRDSPRVSAKRRREIQTEAERLGYRPDPMLTSLAAYRQAKRPVIIGSTIAWINQWKNPRALYRLHEFEAYWKGAQEAASRLGYRLEEFLLNAEMTGARLQRILLARGVRGILIPPHADGALAISDFDWSHFSVVRLGISVQYPRAHVVTSDQMNCSALALERVLKQGYRRVGYVSSRHFDRRTGGNFRAGFLSSQDALVPAKRQVLPLFLEEETTPACARRLRAWIKSAAPDAIISTLPELASLLQLIGCNVPRDIAVATLSVLDGNFDCGVDQNSHEVGLVAMRTLAGLIHVNERGIPRYCRRILVEGRWVDGSSLP